MKNAAFNTRQNLNSHTQHAPWDFAVILIFIPFKTYEKTSFTEY